MPTFNNISFVCNCPDATKTKRYSPRGGSLPLFLDWSNSNAGAQNGECIHVWATRLVRGEIKEEDIPNDIPLYARETLAEETPKEVWQEGSGGHSFGNAKDFGFKEFGFYKGG